jgi:hypothetical protein
MAKSPKKDETVDERSLAETERIREATLKRLLNTPPKPFTKSARKTKGTYGKPKISGK